jgi:hypothetical protein
VRQLPQPPQPESGTPTSRGGHRHR